MLCKKRWQVISFDMFDRRAVFIDRDGTIVQSIKRDWPDMHSVTAPWFINELVIVDKAKAGMLLLKKLGFMRIMATNQPDVSTGRTTKERWSEIQNEILRKLSFDDVFMCRHPRNCNCFMRKPAPGMLLAAADKYGINLSKSYMIGDTENDTKAGWGAGCQTILIAAEHNESVKSDYRVASFWEAVKLIEKLEK